MDFILDCLYMFIIHTIFYCSDILLLQWFRQIITIILLDAPFDALLLDVTGADFVGTFVVSMEGSLSLGSPAIIHDKVTDCVKYINRINSTQ